MPSPEQTATEAGYAVAVELFGKAVALMREGQFEQARATFESIDARAADEPALGERARMYARVCAQRLAGPPTEPTTADGCYRQGVVAANRLDLEEALRLLDRAVHAEPASARFLYARASAWALKGNADAAIADLRQAIALDPPTRFQASNDPDFERIREEPAFIDIIEPTPAGA